MTSEEKETLSILQQKARMEQELTYSKKKKGRFMKGVIITIMLFLFLFTLTCLYITYCTSTEPSTLIVSVFGFCGLECGILGTIKKSKDGGNNGI